MRFRLIVTGRTTVVIVPLLTFALLLVTLFGGLPVLFLPRLPVLPGLFSLTVGLGSTLLRTTVSTLFLFPVTVVVAVFATVAVTATLAFTVTVKAGEALLFQQVYRLFRFGAMVFFCQAVGLDAASVQADDLKSPSAADGHQVGGDILVARVGYQIAQDVSLEEEELAILRFQGNLT